MHHISFAGRRFRVLPGRALFWPERQALLVADLHLEKASWFAGHGQMLPPYDSIATLTRLLALAEACDAQEIWALGDSFHDAIGPERLPDAALALLDRLAQGRRIIWIAGNHDGAATLPGERVEEQRFDGLVLRHEAEHTETEAEISGHFHPKLRLTAGGRTVARPCFVLSSSRLILPAFGTLTGGLDAHSAPILSVVGPSAEAIVPSETRLMRFPLRPQLLRPHRAAQPRRARR